MAKFTAGQRVEIAFNPPPPGSTGKGDYQRKPDFGTVVEAIESEAGQRYLVDVELSVVHTRNGKPYTVSSVRKRVIDEAKLKAA